MARVGFWQTGFSLYPPDRLPFLLPGVFTDPGFSVTPAEGFAYVWNVKTIRMDYSLVVDSGTGPVVVTGSCDSTNIVPLVDERDIGLVGYLVVGGTFPADSAEFVTVLNSYNDGLGLFFLYCLVDIGGVTNENTGTPCPVTLNAFTHSMSMYMPPAFVSATGTITLSVHEFWEYRDAFGNNPIWDASTGVQLISPIPRGI